MPHYLTLNTVFSSLLYHTIFPEGIWVIRDVISFQCHVFFAQEFIRLFWKVVPLSDLILSGVPCCHKMCLPRPEMVSWTEAMVYRECGQPASCCLYHGEYVPRIWCVHGSGPVYQVSPYWKPSCCPLLQGKFTSVAWLIAAHASHSWMICAMASMVRSVPHWWAHLFVAADVSWPHQVINSSPFHTQSKCT